jgi:hypothetical protein
MLEIYLDPNSALFQQGVLDQNKEMVLFCAGGVRSALAVKALKIWDMKKYLILKVVLVQLVKVNLK